MKKLLILALFVALGVGLHASKPSEPERSFAHFLRDHNGENEFVADLTAKTCTFEDHFFWVDARQDGKTIYTNVFHNWVNRAELRKSVKKDVNAAEQTVQQAKDNLSKP